MAHLTLQQLWMLSAMPIIDDTAESKHLKNCPRCMEAVRWFVNSRALDNQAQAETEAVPVLVTDR
jgi:hypothetical protein